MKLHFFSKVIGITALISAVAFPLAGFSQNGSYQDGSSGSTSQNSSATTFQARLDGYQETPSISSTGGGDFQAQIDESANTISYQLSYSGLEASPTMAHLHFAQKGVNGGIVVTLCDNTGGVPSRVQSCPSVPATISGTITTADVTAGAANQGIDAGEIAELIRAMRNGVIYTNVHTSKYPNGEIRGQIKAPRSTSGTSNGSSN